VAYANQPVVRAGGTYFSRHTNFVDFLGVLVGLAQDATLLLPVKSLAAPPTEDFVALQLPREKVVEVMSYKGHVGAMLAAIVNLWRVRRTVSAESRKGPVVVVMAGPSTLLTLLSYLLPISLRFAVFVRGDTVATVRSIFASHPFGVFPRLLVRWYDRRLERLLSRRQAVVFAFGPHLVGKYRVFGEALGVSALLGAEFLSQDPIPRRNRSGVLRCLFIGRFSEEKGVLALVEAFADPQLRGMPVSLTLVGFGHLQQRVRALIEQRGLSESVSLVGHLRPGPGIREAMDQHDLLLLPSRTEGLPRVVAEAFARGLPVMATPVGGLPAQFPREVRYLDGGSPKDIVAGLRWALEHRKELAGFARLGRERVPELTLEENARATLRVIERLTP
jgi:hypothetical protein